MPTLPGVSTAQTVEIAYMGMRRECQDAREGTLSLEGLEAQELRRGGNQEKKKKEEESPR